MLRFLKYIMVLIPFLIFCSKSMAGQLTLGADLIQPILLGGWNLNGYYYFDNGFVFGWSHGDDLKMSFDDSFAPDPVKDAKASIFTDWSTGPELGYRLGKNWDVRMDFKAHYSRIKFDSNPAPIKYTLYTVGPSLFYNWFPFSGGDTSGFLVQFSARYWVEVGDDFDDDNYTYTDKNGSTKKHDPRDFWDGGISGFGANVTFGWAF